MGRIVDSYTNILTVKLFARAERRGQLRARRGRSPHRRVPRGAAAADGVRHRAQRAQRAADRRRRRDRAGAVAARRGRGRRHRHGAAADAPAHQHVAPDRGADHRPVRGDRHRAGRHDDDRAPLQLVDPEGAKPLAVREGKIAFDDVQLRLRPRDAACCEGFLAHRAAGREDRPGRPLRRRQVDRRQPAAALLRSRRRPHPDRRPGHFADDAGEPALADFRGDAGHLAAAPLDPREHPLRPAGRDRRRDRRRRAARARRGIHRDARRLARAATATTPRSASAASSFPAASASASRSRA